MLLPMDIDDAVAVEVLLQVAVFDVLFVIGRKRLEGHGSLTNYVVSDGEGET